MSKTETILSSISSTHFLGVFVHRRCGCTNVSRGSQLPGDLLVMLYLHFRIEKILPHLSQKYRYFFHFPFINSGQNSE